MLFLNTRPSPRAQELTDVLQQHGVRTFHLPLLELVEQDLDATLIQLYQQLAQVDVIVVVSPTAVQVGMRYLTQLKLNLPQVKWIAVGEKTALELKKYDIDAQVPELETSEGMLQIPYLKQLLTGSKIAFWRGEGGRQFMMQHLQQQGMQILNFVLYKRCCPTRTIEQISTLQLTLQQDLIQILITSEASWRNWLTLNIHLNQVEYLVLGDRLYRILEQYSQQYHVKMKLKKLTNLKPETILHHIFE